MAILRKIESEISEKKEKHSSFKRQASVNILEGQFLGQFLGQFPAQFCGQDQLEKVKHSSFKHSRPSISGHCGQFRKGQRI